MIGVLAHNEMAAVVEEFFELFKTPWEWYVSGRAYDVIVSNIDEIPGVAAKLLIVYGSATREIDARLGINVGRRLKSAVLNAGNRQLPLYCGVVAFENRGREVACVTTGGDEVGLRINSPDSIVIRLGFDLFEEVRFLLSDAQPIEQAHIPTVDVHISMLRNWILAAGIAVVEIPPVPVGSEFFVCLTHDIDFVGIRDHKFDHSMWGFVHRATIGAIYSFLRGRLSFIRLLRNWQAVLSLPFVFRGWAKDFWAPFEWYLEAERGLPSTYFLIPFKRRAGDRVPGPRASRRATAYDVSDIPQWTSCLQKEGCELGVHGIDAWNSAEKGRDELGRIAAAAGGQITGIRMHWLLQDAGTPAMLERAGYVYDSTSGYNETVGYRAGTSQVFRPFGAGRLLELPMHIQDGALFYPQRLDLSEPEAKNRCEALIENSRSFGGVLTLLWHDRSHAPERFWGDFYVRLVESLKSLGCRFGTAAQVVGWFQKRRKVRFERVGTSNGARLRVRLEESVEPALRIRVHRPMVSDGGDGAGSMPIHTDLFWDGAQDIDIDVATGSRVLGGAS